MHRDRGTVGSQVASDGHSRRKVLVAVFGSIMAVVGMHKDNPTRFVGMHKDNPTFELEDLLSPTRPVDRLTG
jgi:hypothetical protein